MKKITALLLTACLANFPSQAATPKKSARVEQSAASASPTQAPAKTALSESDRQETTNWILEKLRKHYDKNKKNLCWTKHQFPTNKYSSEPRYEIKAETGELLFLEGCGYETDNGNHSGYKQKEYLFPVAYYASIACEEETLKINAQADVVKNTDSHLFCRRYDERKGREVDGNCDYSGSQLQAYMEMRPFRCNGEPNLIERMDRAFKHLKQYYATPESKERF